MTKQDKIKIRGKVMEVISNDQYKVMLENNITIRAHICGKMRLRKIKILPGDFVEVELSPYDLTQGRIVYRSIN